jgi:hypothetical protein
MSESNAYRWHAPIICKPSKSSAKFVFFFGTILRVRDAESCYGFCECGLSLCSSFQSVENRLSENISISFPLTTRSAESRVVSSSRIGQAPPRSPSTPRQPITGLALFKEVSRLVRGKQNFAKGGEDRNKGVARDPIIYLGPIFTNKGLNVQCNLI